MPYAQGARLPAEAASKLGHLAVITSPWVQSLVSDFENAPVSIADPSKTQWHSFDPAGVTPLNGVWAVDGSFVSVTSGQKPPREVAFVKTALLLLDRAKLDAIDKDLPHPLMLRDAVRDTGVQHATVFPLKNIRTSMGTNFDAVRHIVRDSICVDQKGAFHETMKWLAYKKWDASLQATSPAFQCPRCGEVITSGLAHDADEGECTACAERVFLSDIWGFHMEMAEEGAPDSLASAYMLVMEHLMLFTAVRLMWNHSDKALVSETLFIKDGPLTLRGQYSKVVPCIRSFLQHAYDAGRPIHIIGQEKSGAFCDHLGSIARFASPHNRGERMTYSVLSHEYVHEEVYRTPSSANLYGLKTNWGEKVYVKLDPGSHLVLSIPTGEFLNARDRPIVSDVIGLNRILATIPALVSHKFEGALFPVELANGIASMSSYPSAAILQRFLDG